MYLPTDTYDPAIKLLFVPEFKAEGYSTESNWKACPLNRQITESAAAGWELRAQII
tara:strand:+ start:145 stop:312 length:168 start_codon:yes stop_codon:yes gene_type:complete